MRVNHKFTRRRIVSCCTLMLVVVSFCWGCGPAEGVAPMDVAELPTALDGTESKALILQTVLRQEKGQIESQTKWEDLAARGAPYDWSSRTMITCKDGSVANLTVTKYPSQEAAVGVIDSMEELAARGTYVANPRSGVVKNKRRSQAAEEVVGKQIHYDECEDSPLDCSTCTVNGVASACDVDIWSNKTVVFTLVSAGASLHDFAW